MLNLHRRKILLGMAGIITTSSSTLAGTLLTTPRQTAGPFYPPVLPLDDDNDLTRVNGRSGQARGIISDLSGRIVDINGRPLPGLRIEIWQCDVNGRYRHPAENASRDIDPDFQGHGFSVTDALGRYRFRTIRPEKYPGRTPHIHVAVFPPGETPFVTQLYVKDDPRNAEDFLFQSIPLERQHLLLAEFKPARPSAPELEARFDIILARNDGTPQQG